jgi:hypothetical protein
MKKILTGALAALTVGGALAASTVPASAAPWHGGWHGGGWGYGAAGLIGLATGAAIASSYHPYYPPVYYGPPPAYYGPPCRVEMRWNPNWGGYDRVRVCY